MVSTFSNLGIEEPAQGDYASSWANVANTNYTLLDNAISAITSVDVTGAADKTLTQNNGAADQSRNAVLVIKGAPSNQLSVLYPNNMTKVVHVRSKVAYGGFNVIVNTVAKTGSGCTIAAGESKNAYSDGVRVYQLGGTPKGIIQLWAGTTTDIPAGWAHYSTADGRWLKFGGVVATPAAVNPTVSIGTPATGTTAATSLTEAQMPKHAHRIAFDTLATVPSGSGSMFGVQFASGTATTSAGGNDGHTHSLVGSHTHPISVSGGSPIGMTLIPIRKIT
jgi:hypothetical protein